MFIFNEKLEGKVDQNFILAWTVVFALVILQMAANLGPWFVENKELFRKERKNFLEVLDEPIPEVPCDYYDRYGECQYYETNSGTETDPWYRY